MIIGSKYLIRDINTSNVIETIIKDAPISRVEISKKTGLTKGTITSIVQSLIDDNLVIETSYTGTGIGRKSLLLELAPNSGYCISISINSQTIRFMVSDLRGQKIHYNQIENVNFETVNEVISLNIKKYNLNLNESPFGLIGISIGISSFAETQINLKSLQNFMLSQFSIPVHIFNESIFSVLGENAYSAKSDNIVFVDNTEFISMGAILSGKALIRKNSKSYNLGNMVLENNSTKAYSTLNNLCSVYSLFNILNQEKDRTKCCCDFLKKLKQNDPEAEKIASIFVKYMCIAIKNIMIFYSPDIIVVNSPLICKSDEIFIRLKNSLGKNKGILYRSVLNEDAVLYGGAAYCIMDFLKIETFKPARCYFKNLKLI